MPPRTASSSSSPAGNLREAPAPFADTAVANLTAPLLGEVAARLEEVPQRLICSGLLASEADRVTDAFAERGLMQRERRHQDEWTAIYLTAPTAAGHDNRAHEQRAQVAADRGASTRGSAASPSCTSSWSRFPRRTTSIWGTRKGSRTEPSLQIGFAPASRSLSRFLLARGAKLLVIACNSATSAGAGVARARGGRGRGSRCSRWSAPRRRSRPRSRSRAGSACSPRRPRSRGAHTGGRCRSTLRAASSTWWRSRPPTWRRSSRTASRSTST